MLPSILPDSPQTGIPFSLGYKISDSMATIINAERRRNVNFPQVLLWHTKLNESTTFMWNLGVIL
jgi:hypothetical protein